MKVTKRVFLILFFLVSIQSKSQSLNSIFDYFDSQVSPQNSHLFNGRLYINSYLVLNSKNQFLKANKNYTIGNITIENITFNQIELQYDLFSQELIVKPDPKTSLYGVIVDSTKLTHFTMYGLHFVNLKSTENSSLQGIYELSIDKPIALLIKHKARRFKKLDKNSIHYEFEPKYDYYIAYNNNYITVHSKKDCIKLFPEFKKEIKNFSSENAYIEKNDPKEFMKKLVLYINTLKVVINEK